MVGKNLRNLTLKDHRTHCPHLELDQIWDQQKGKMFLFFFNSSGAKEDHTPSPWLCNDSGLLMEICFQIPPLRGPRHIRNPSRFSELCLSWNLLTGTGQSHLQNWALNLRTCFSNKWVIHAYCVLGTEQVFGKGELRKTPSLPLAPPPDFIWIKKRERESFLSRCGLAPGHTAW